MKKALSLTKKTFAHFSKHNASRMGAAVSYYAVFSIAPLCVILIQVAGFFLGATTVQRNVTGYIRTMFGQSTGNFVSQLIGNAHWSSIGTVATVVSIVSLIVAAVSVLSELDSDMDELWHVATRARVPKRSGFMEVLIYLKRQLIALSVIPLIGLLLIGSAIVTQVFGLFGHLGFFTTIVDAVISFGLGAVLFALIFRILPDTKLSVGELLLGGVMTSTLFLLGKILIGVYVNDITNTTSFGAAGDLVVFLIWIYYSAQVFFLGASFTFVYSKEYGTLSKKLSHSNP